jgi:hypothetical protein
LIVESSDDFTPEPALGLPLVCSAGHAREHPLTLTQLFLSPRSLVNSYSVKPEDVERISPRLVWCSSTVVALLEWAVAMPVCALAIAETLIADARAALRTMDILFMGLSEWSGIETLGNASRRVLLIDIQRPRSAWNLPERRQLEVGAARALARMVLSLSLAG